MSGAKFLFDSETRLQLFAITNRDSEISGPLLSGQVLSEETHACYTFPTSKRAPRTSGPSGNIIMRWVETRFSQSTSNRIAFRLGVLVKRPTREAMDLSANGPSLVGPFRNGANGVRVEK